MKALIALFIGGIAVAAVALALDSWFVLMGSVALIGVAALGLFVQGWRAAAAADAQVAYMAVLAGSIAAVALGVASIVVGVRADAPGLVLFAIAVLVGVVVGVFVIGLKTAQQAR